MIEYEDRGILKWQGFFLSDHTEKIEKEINQNRYRNVAREQMTSEEISEVINAAMLKSKSVRIQKEERDPEGYYPDDVVGIIAGFDELGLYIGEEKVNYDEIRHISMTEINKWSDI